jgi:hypothetical protein
MNERKIIWASWRLRRDGRVEVVATHSGPEGHEQERLEYDSLDEAAQELGLSFRDVVERSAEAGSHTGRWRP